MMYNTFIKIIFLLLDGLNFLRNFSLLIQGVFLKITPIDSKRDYIGIKHNGITFMLKTHDDLDELKLKFLAACSNLLLMRIFKGQKIYVFLVSKDSMISKYKQTEDDAGFVKKHKNAYFIFIKNDLNFQQLKKHLMHELGHTLDMILAEGLTINGNGLYSELDKDFKKIFKEEKWVYKYENEDTHKIKLFKYGIDITEYFAQSFCNVILGETGFSIEAPKTYKLISDIIYS